MTSIEILEDILTHYDSHQEWQTEIAKRYNVSQTLISELLQECGFVRGKFMNGKTVDINIAWQNPKVQEICKKISDVQS